VGHFAPLHRLPPALEVLGVGRLELVFLDARVHAAANVMQIDREHRRNVDVARIAHDDRACLPPLGLSLARRWIHFGVHPRPGNRITP
jgi:hypothetical protein